MTKAFLGAVLALLSAACEVRSEVNVRVADDGSGAVEVGVGLDAEALERVGDPAEQVIVDDLVSTGWEVGEPTTDPDGFTWLRATKRFATPAEGEDVLGEVTDTGGDEGAVLRDVVLSRADSFTTTTHSFEAVLDLSDGLAAFSDPALTEALDGEPVGESVADLEARFGAPVADLFSMSVSVELPGEEVSTTVEGGVDAWSTRPGASPVVMAKSSEIRDQTPLVWAAVAGAAAMSLAGLLGWRLVGRVRTRRASDTRA